VGDIVWVTHMKTTIELSDGLLAEARRVARREGLTLKALLELGLRRAIDDRKSRRTFKLRDASVPGKGLTREARAVGWHGIRDMASREHDA
jgi:hypothetical protein